MQRTVDWTFRDDEDDHPSLNEALLQVSNKFSCSCDAASSILVALAAPCIYNYMWRRLLAGQTHIYNSLQLLVPTQQLHSKVFFVGFSGTATTCCRRKPLVIDSD